MLFGKIRAHKRESTLFWMLLFEPHFIQPENLVLISTRGAKKKLCRYVDCQQEIIRNHTTGSTFTPSSSFFFRWKSLPLNAVETGRKNYTMCRMNELVSLKIKLGHTSVWWPFRPVIIYFIDFITKQFKTRPRTC